MKRYGQTRIAPIAMLALVLFAIALLPKVLAAVENAPVSDKPVPAVIQPPSKTIETPPETNAVQNPPVPEAASKPVKEFKPSETIGADSAVSFPVDI